MKGYRLRLRPLSPWASPLHADTFFGAICWAWADLHGRESLEAMLARFARGEPDFVLSDGLPADLVPFPALAERASADPKNKGSYAHPQEFAQFARGERTALTPYSGPLTGMFGQWQAQIGRDTDTTAEGNLFEVDRESFDPAKMANTPGDPYISVYFRCRCEARRDLEACFHFLEYVGVGRKRSTGMGAFAAVDLTEWPQLEPLEGANGFVSWSHFVPAESDPTDGAWRIHVTYPKFQGNRVRRFLKGSVIFLTPGSSFAVFGDVRPWYGRMIPARREELPGALHYGLGLAVPVRLSKEIAEGARPGNGPRVQA